ncbi:MAG TPA: hypothetical protein VF151_10815 [Gemmatimonadales bacterium]
MSAAATVYGAVQANKARKEQQAAMDKLSQQAPTSADLPAKPAMPNQDSQAAQRAMKLSLMDLAKRRGRAASILTDSGGGSVLGA